MFIKHEFLHDSDLQKRIFEIFKSAKREIIIISPYIKLYDKIKDELSLHKNNPKIEITILYGKSHKLSTDDIEFIRSFPNVVVKYKENLHTKFYANERLALITSVNLYESSLKNNYETGVLIEYMTEIESFLSRYWVIGIPYWILYFLFWIIIGALLTIVTLDFKLFERDKLTSESDKYIRELIIKSDQIVFQKEVVKKREYFGLIKVYSESKVIVDRFEEMSCQSTGYCIRLGIPIDFNPNQPYCKESYYDWVNEGSNRNHPENFCHRTGKNTNGKVSINNPILYS